VFAFFQKEKKNNEGDIR